MNNSGFICGLHHSYIVDDIGIDKIFSKIKTQLAEKEKNQVTLLYLSQSNQFFFEKELDLLEKEYTLQFIVFYENTIEANLIQAATQTILNINVMSEMNFIISGNKGFYNSIANHLKFSGINQIQIQKQYFV